MQAVQAVQAVQYRDGQVTSIRHSSAPASPKVEAEPPGEVRKLAEYGQVGQSAFGCYIGLPTLVQRSVQCAVCSVQCVVQRSTVFCNIVLTALCSV